jgi:hypothetical protein
VKWMLITVVGIADTIRNENEYMGRESDKEISYSHA